MSSIINLDGLLQFELPLSKLDSLDMRNVFYISEMEQNKTTTYDFIDIKSYYRRVIARDLKQKYLAEYSIKKLFILSSIDYQRLVQNVNINDGKVDDDDDGQKFYVLKIQADKARVENQNIKLDIDIILRTYDNQTFFVYEKDQFCYTHQIHEEERKENELSLSQSNTTILGTQLNMNIEDERSFNCLQNITNLLHLRLSFKSYTLEVSVLEKFICSLKDQSILSTIYLNISFNQFSSDQLSKLGRAFGEIINLRKLKLILQGITITNQESITSLLDEISKSTKIEDLYLNLEYNKLNNQQAAKICFSIAKFSSLKSLYLNLDQNQVSTYRDQTGLFSILQSMKNLTEFKISFEYNQIKENEVDCFQFADIGKLAQLESFTLNLGSNFIGNNGISKIGEGLQSLVNLKKLGFAMNYQKLGDPRNISLISGLKNCQQMEHLTLGLSSSVTSDNIADIIDMITALTRLYFLKLQLEFNKLAADDALSIIRCVYNHPRINNFRMSIHVGEIQNKMKRILLKKPRFVDYYLFTTKLFGL